MPDQQRALLTASAAAISELAVSEHDSRLTEINAVHDDTDYLAFDDDFVDTGTLACAAIGPVLAWLGRDAADEQLAAALLRGRPGDSDLTTVRAEVRAVLDALLDVLVHEYPVEGAEPTTEYTREPAAEQVRCADPAAHPAVAELLANLGDEPAGVFVPLLDPHRRSAAAPNACAVCSWPAREHAQIWHGQGVGFQGWQAPGDELRKARLLLARKIREGSMADGQRT